MTTIHFYRQTSNMTVPLRALETSTGPQNQRKTMSRIDQIHQNLQKLVALTPDLEGALLVTLDGLPIASALAGGTDEDRVAAMGAAALATGTRTVSELKRGELEQVLVKGSDGYIVHIAAGPEAVLIGISNGYAKLGMILFEMKATAKDLARELA